MLVVVDVYIPPFGNSVLVPWLSDLITRPQLLFVALSKGSEDVSLCLKNTQ